MFRLFKRWLGRSSEDRPFPREWAEIVDRNVPLARALPEADQRELERLILAFIDDKTFEGAGGFEVNDEVRVTIAAQACVLLLHRDTEIYPELDTVLVYPSAYVAKTRSHDGPVVIEGDVPRLGESWERGLVVLAWDAVQRGTANVGDGHNVVLHEFAHQLDQEDGVMDGAPDLGKRARYATWARVLGEEYADLVDRVHAGRAADIDPYGATSPPEFFAVVTEMFFEKPVALRARHPELYATLADFYRQDPASFATNAASAAPGADE
ncbi:MAG: zinc-dependent peptidase [Labilithrix sp.]|nr:zinc-dependent peptidase [Labilithrix sp.]MCW5837765.1 zinc-dependent peptidase [Labilithrix sp.]